jgi:hypothetical protein
VDEEIVDYDTEGEAPAEDAEAEEEEAVDD